MLPAEMAAINISRPGGPEVLVLDQRAVPTPNPNEILIKVAAAGINRGDVVQRLGSYPPPSGASDIPGLEVAGEVILKAKGPEDGYSGFSVTDLPTGERRETGLEQLLRDRGVDHVVIAGLTTDYCVKETALDAVRKGFDTDVIVEATRPVDVAPGDGERALREIEQAGVKLD